MFRFCSFFNGRRWNVLVQKFSSLQFNAWLKICQESVGISWSTWYHLPQPKPFIIFSIFFRVFPLANRPKYVDRHFGTTLNVKETSRLMPMPELSRASRSSPSPSGWTWRTGVTGVTRVWRRILGRVAYLQIRAGHGTSRALTHLLHFSLRLSNKRTCYQANWHPMKVIELFSPTMSKSPELMYARHQKRMRTSSSFSLDWAQHSWANSQDWLGGAGHGSGWRIMKNFLTGTYFSMIHPEDDSWSAANESLFFLLLFLFVLLILLFLLFLACGIARIAR